MEFVYLNVKSYCNYNSTVKNQPLMTKIKEKGGFAVGQVDEVGFHNVVDFYEAAMKEGVNPIIGATVSVLDSAERPQKLFLYAKNVKGYQNLCKLQSMMNEAGNSFAAVSMDTLARHQEGLLVVLKDRTGYAIGSYLARQKEKLLEELKQLLTMFSKDDIYVAVNRQTEEEKIDSKAILQFSKQTGLKIVVLPEIRYLEREDALVSEILFASYEKRKMEKPKVDYSMLTLDEIKQLYLDCPEGLTNTVELANKCKVELPLKGSAQYARRLPKFEIPSGIEIPEHFEIYQNKTKKVEFKNELEKKRSYYLCLLAWKGLKQRYGLGNKLAMERLQNELGVIISKGFADFFLIAQDFIQFAKRKGIPVGPGRGSVVGSIAAYCLGITEICPLKYNLLFERFLNEKREADPDIDVDVSLERRKEIIAYLMSKYGHRHVSQIMTHDNYGAREAVKQVTIGMGGTQEEASKMAEYVPSDIKNLNDFLESDDSKTLRSLFEKFPKMKEIFGLACKIEGFPSHESTHGVGILLSEREIDEEVPVKSKSDKNGDEILVTQIPNNNNQLERLGLVKFDLLPLRATDILDKVEKRVEKRRGLSIKEVFIEEDKQTFDCYQQGGIGIFQMDSPGMREAGKEIKPSSIKEIMALIALYRPATLSMIPMYVRNKKNEKNVLYDNNNKPLSGVGDVSEALAETKGIVSYQEQAMLLAHIWAGYDYKDADILRSAISKKKKEVLLEQREQFIAKSKTKGRDEKTSHLIYDIIVKFADYGLGKSHAAAYAFLSYKTAFYKTHFPLEYMTELMNANIKSAAPYIEECRRMGIVVCGPDVNTSGVEFDIVGNTISFGLPLIKNVGASHAAIIVKERGKGYASFSDFYQRVKGKLIPRETIESLIKAGAFDSFGKRKEILNQLSRLVSQETEEQGLEEDQYSIWESVKKEEPVEEFSLSEKKAMEKALMGVSFANGKGKLLVYVPDFTATEPFLLWMEKVKGFLRQEKGSFDVEIVREGIKVTTPYKVSRMKAIEEYFECEQTKIEWLEG